jgi:hypothetical protein
MLHVPFATVAVPFSVLHNAMASVTVCLRDPRAGLVCTNLWLASATATVGHDHHDDHHDKKAAAPVSGPPAGLKHEHAASLGSPLIMDVKKGLWFGTIFAAGASLSE